MKARADVFRAKATLLQEYVDKVDGDDAAIKADLEKYKTHRDVFGANAHECESMYIKSVEQIEANELNDLVQKINDHEKAFKEREVLYSDYYELSHAPSEGLDKFRNELLMHLASSIVVKDHKIRY